MIQIKNVIGKSYFAGLELFWE